MPPIEATVDRASGERLRDWRRRRRLSQLALATEAQVSQHHLSFVESGRASPSREMVLHLAEHLAVPLRDRNALLLSAGFAPAHRERVLDAAAMKAVHETASGVLAAHEPAPALAVERHWNMPLANDAVGLLTDGAAASLLEPPVNVLRLGLHPDGLAPRIANLRPWRDHLLRRLERQIELSNDAVLRTLLAELRGYPLPPRGRSDAIGSSAVAELAVPPSLNAAGRPLAFISTTMVFGTALDIALPELAVETFPPADEATANALRSMLPVGSGRRAHGSR